MPLSRIGVSQRLEDPRDPLLVGVLGHLEADLDGPEPLPLKLEEHLRNVFTELDRRDVLGAHLQRLLSMPNGARRRGTATILLAISVADSTGLSGLWVRGSVRSRRAALLPDLWCDTPPGCGRTPGWAGLPGFGRPRSASSRASSSVILRGRRAELRAQNQSSGVASAGMSST